MGQDYSLRFCSSIAIAGILRKSSVNGFSDKIKDVQHGNGFSKMRKIVMCITYLYSLFAKCEK